jgi:3D (Asp-Asp-Asp) domain-containing protein
LTISAPVIALVLVVLALLAACQNDSAQLENGDSSIRGTDQHDANEAPASLELLREVELPTVAALPTAIEIDDSLDIRIVDGDEEISLRTGARTVGEALREANIVVEVDDVIEPDLAVSLEPDQEITIRRSIPLAIRVDGRVILTRSHFLKVADVLAQAGIVLEGQDYAFPGLDHQLLPGDTIQVTRVTEEIRFEDVPVPFETMWQGVEDMELDQHSLITSGVPGILRRQYRTRYEDGVVFGETLAEDSFVQQPVNEVMGYGTKINIRVLEAPEGPLEYWRVVKMRVTAYTAASSGKPPDHPAYGITASGLEAGTGIVAIDPKVVPFRSWVYVPGYGIGFAGDTGGSVKGRWIDLGYNEDELLAWSGYVDVYYLTPAPAPENINYIIPALP